MMKLTLAAAFAVGMTTVALAQEAPANAESMQAMKAANVQALKSGSANADKPADKDNVLKVGFSDRGRISVSNVPAKPAEKTDVASADAAKAEGLPGVDDMKTASVTAEKKTEKTAEKKTEKTAAKKAEKAEKTSAKAEKTSAKKASAKTAEDKPELVVTHRNNGTASMVSMKGTKAVERAAGGKVAKAASGKFGAIIAKYAATYGVPVDLAHAVIRVESNYRPDARGAAGEVGLMQIKPATARGMGYSGSVKALYSPENNIKYGMKYLGIAHKLGGGTTCGTILKYNAGHGAKRMNKISAAYCSKVKRHLGA